MRLLGFILFVSFFVAALGVAGDNKWTSNGPYGGLVSELVFHPTTPNVVFARGAGLYRSKDSGKTWEPLSLASWAPVVRVHPDEPDVVVAATDRIYRSPDRGTTWLEIGNPEVPEGDSFLDLEFDPANREILYGVTRTHGVYKSTDAGRSWIQKSKGLDLNIPPSPHEFSRLEIDPDNSSVLYVMLLSAKVYKTINGGESWKLASKGLKPGSAFSLSIDPFDPRILYAGGIDGLFRTTDGGVSWSQMNIGYRAIRSIGVSRITPGEVYASAGGGYVLKSTDRGLTWNAQKTGQRDIWTLAIHPKQKYFILTGTAGEGVYRSLNDGKIWQNSSNGIGANADQLVAFPTTISPMYATSWFTSYVSRNAGAKWDIASLWKDHPDLQVIPDVKIHPNNPRIVAAAVGTGPFAISTDSGTTWEVLNHQDWWGYKIALDSRDPRIVYLAGERSTGPLGFEYFGMAKSTDQGHSWKLINDGLSDRSQITVIAIDPQKTSSLLVGTESGKIFRSVDGGGHWKKLSGAPEGTPIKDILYDLEEAQTIWLSTRGRIYRSTDHGKSWIVKNETGAEYFAQDPTNYRTMFASGFGTILVSNDHGDTWSAFDSTGLGAFNINDVLVDPGNRNRLFIATSQGVYSYTRKAAGNGPLIEQLVPAVGRAGDVISIIGRGFGQLQGTSSLLFKGINAGQAQSWSDTSIKVAVPSGAHTGYVTATVLGRKSNPYEFIVLPATGNIDPTSGPSAGGTRVTILAPSGISGTQFNVLFGSTVAANVRFTAPNVITCDSPPGTSTVQVNVTSSAVTTTVGTFTYY